MVAESIRLNLLDSETQIEIRRNLSHSPKDGVAIFELHNTHVIVHWQNVAKADLLTLLQNHIKLVSARDVTLISTFDRNRGQ